MTWAKSTRNYFISKAHEMEKLLKWAEKFQTTTITSQHVEDVNNQGMCMDHSAGKLSRDLWGFMNLNIPGTSRDRNLFDGATGGNGFDAWRRILEPLGPNTEERLYTMHDQVTHPKPSKHVKEIIQDLNTWEGELDEYYRCGGEHLSEITKLRTAHRMLPDTTPASVRLSVKNCVNYDTFKRELRTTLRYLEDFGGMKSGSAHLVDQPQRNEEPAATADQQASAEEDEVDMVAFITSLVKGGCDHEMVLAAVQRVQRGGPKSRTGPYKPRARTPPRDPKDKKCANCNEKGHEAVNCPKAKMNMSDRRCHTCNKAGHLARNCPDKDKKPTSGGQVRLALQDTQRVTAMMITEDDGFTRVGHRPIPKGTFISELPTRRAGGNQASRRNQFAPLMCSGYSNNAKCKEACCTTDDANSSQAADAANDHGRPIAAMRRRNEDHVATRGDHGRSTAARGDHGRSIAAIEAPPFNSPAKVAGSREQKENRRATKDPKGHKRGLNKNSPTIGQTRFDEDIDQVIKEFIAKDAVTTATTAAKGVRQTKDAVVVQKNKMSPVREEQLHDGTLQAVNPAHRELIRQIDIRHRAKADAGYEDEEPAKSDDNEYELPHRNETANGGNTHQAMTITAEQRALLQLLGTLDQAEARIAALNQTTMVNNGQHRRAAPGTSDHA